MIVPIIAKTLANRGLARGRRYQSAGFYCCNVVMDVRILRIGLEAL